MSANRVGNIPRRTRDGHIHIVMAHNVFSPHSCVNEMPHVFRGILEKVVFYKDKILRAKSERVQPSVLPPTIPRSVPVLYVNSIGAIIWIVAIPTIYH